MTDYAALAALAAGWLSSGAPAQAADIERGRALAAASGCSGCHTIPGVAAGANVGPSLEDIGRRVYIAGLLPNNVENMASWIVRTQQIRPGVAMPSTDLSADEAADLAAFLETLR